VTGQRPVSGSEPTRRPVDAARLRRETARRTRNPHAEKKPAGRTNRARDADLPPGDRGPVRAFVRDAVDSRRRLVGLLLPVLGVVVICAVGPASDLQRYLLFGSLALLALVAADAVRMGVDITRAARAELPGEPVPGLATGWYAFLRAHRSRHVRRPPPRVTPGGGIAHGR
jgi:hypothetical protein